ncbi:LamG domain-containing protein [Marinobacter nanhaiticus D15-8W]|uniref:LamG domain-containing protein n=2 Tax=Marinobacter TaxID=2742 RepID=N6WW48_9GAMM|nr:LamG domain-containing protein [Marinobacter nanhaiticus D15-8W]
MTRLAPALLLSVLALTGCKTGDSTESLPNTGTPSNAGNYNGPPPATDDVQNFKLAVWDNLVSTDRCGGCHSTGGQSPMFVHADDINVAYAQANTVVNLDDPGRSLLVAKVAGGHNCWLSSDQACADTITSYIEAWSGNSAGSVKRIELKAPAIKDPGATKSFPDSSSDFKTLIYDPLLVPFCGECHVEGIQTPYIASENVTTAYNEAQSRINLENPALSRLVERLRYDFHNCWDDDCAMSADIMEMAIEDFANELDTDPVDPDLVTSKALTLLGDGLVANAGGRYEDNAIALYEFKAGTGYTAFDTSGVEPALHLNLTGNVEWVGGWGIAIGGAYEDEQTGATVPNGKAQGGTSASRKLHNLLSASGEFSIEAWIVPGNTTQEDARIITYSGSSTARNVTLSQFQQNYEVLLRSSTADQNTAFSTADGDNRLQASLQHVVVNYTPSQGRRIYINGEYTGDMDPEDAGLLNEWDDSFALVMGNETDGNSLWEGTLRMVAIHSRALTESQIKANFDVGVGQKYYLLFSVSDLVDIPESFIVFEVSQFDSYSYLFSAPFFISLVDSQEPSGIPVKGMRIGINGKEAVVGQAYANLDMTLDDDEYRPGVGQPLSRLGTIVALEKGPEADEFFLTFENLNGHDHVRTEPALPAEPTPSNGPETPHIGIKTFDEINASMSRMTGVSVTHPDVAETFATVRQQLPSVETLGGFLASQQMAITQMAIQYCDAMVNDTTLRGSFFPDFDFTESANTAFDTDGRTSVITPLLDNFVGDNLSTQPTDVDVTDELNNLMDRLTTCTGSCDADRTATVVKASCAAVLGSAVTVVQ